MSWMPEVLALLSAIYSVASPSLKQAALAELQAIAAKEAGHPVLQFLLTEAEALVAGLPTTLP